MTTDLTGVWCLVLGSAPLRTPLVVDQKEMVVAVNGAISSWPLVDVWIVNSQNLRSGTRSPRQRRWSELMLRQAAGREVPFALFLTKHDDAEVWTLSHLRKQGTRVISYETLHNEGRRKLETASGARSAAMTKQALSAGMFAAAWCLYQGAERVRLEGFSWRPGYHYLPGGEAPHTRGHEAGDKQAIARLEARYPGRLIHSLRGVTAMAKTPHKPAPAAERARPAATRPAPVRPTAATQQRQQEGLRSAKASLTPAAERANRTEQAKREREAPKGASGRPLVEATEQTFYDNKRRRPGDVFELRERSDFRESCMKWANPDDATGDGHAGDQEEPRRIGLRQNEPPLSERPTAPGGAAVPASSKTRDAANDPLNVG